MIVALDFERGEIRPALGALDEAIIERGHRVVANIHESPFGSEFCQGQVFEISGLHRPKDKKGWSSRETRAAGFRNPTSRQSGETWGTPLFCLFPGGGSRFVQVRTIGVSACKDCAAGFKNFAIRQQNRELMLPNRGHIPRGKPGGGG